MRPGHMRILLVSDLHYTMKQLDWVVVVAGDTLDIGSIVEPDTQIAVYGRSLALRRGFESRRRHREECCPAMPAYGSHLVKNTSTPWPSSVTADFVRIAVRL